MDAEILGARLSATEEAILKIDGRLDELVGKVDAWTSQKSLNSETLVVELAAEVAIAEAEARTAEAEAFQAEAEAQEAEAEARQLEALDLSPEPLPEPEVKLEVIEAQEEPEEKSQSTPSPSRQSDLEDLGLR